MREEYVNAGLTSLVTAVMALILFINLNQGL